MSIATNLTNLELSKKLKEIGVKQKSIFSWGNLEGDTWYLALRGSCVGNSILSAFLASELLMMLPSKLHKHDRTLYLTIIKETDENFEASYYCHQHGQNHTAFASYGRLSDSLANLILTAVLDLKYITIDEINERLAA